MDQRNQRCAPGDLLRCLRQRAERQAIDHDRDSLRQGPRAAPTQPRAARRWAAEIHRPAKTTSIVPAERPQFRDDAPVVAVAAGRRRKIARHRKRDAIHHRAASYQARATCDSAIFTRIALKLTALAAELARARRVAQLVEDVLRQEFGRRVVALELRHVVEIAVVQRLQHRLQHLVRAADVDHDAVLVERCAMNAASMTKVAPCSACAGPNTAPRNEWAIITWSRTSTANTENLLA